MKQIVDNNGKLQNCDKEIRVYYSEDDGKTWDRQFLSLKMIEGADIQQALDDIKTKHENDPEEPKMVYMKQFKMEVHDL